MNALKKSAYQSINSCQIFPKLAQEKITKMILEINSADKIIKNISSTAQSSAIKGGFAAETFHAESFNLDAILKDNDIRAFTDQFQNTPLTKNNPVNDIVVIKDGDQVLGAQLKYFKDSESTQKAFRSTKDGIHQYENSDIFIGPSDQIDGIRSSAEKAALKNQQTRPEVSQAAEKIRDNVTGQIDVDGIQSTPLSKREAEQLGSGSETGQKLHEKMQDDYLNKATLQQTMRAAGSAAVMTAITAGCINSFQNIQQVRNGKITVEQATLNILTDTVIAAGDSALKAGTATASVSIAARFLPELFSGSTFQSSLATSGIAGAAVCITDLVQCIVLVSIGRMTPEELETRTGKNILQTGAAVVGSSVGASIGVLGGPIGMLVGSLVGGMITSLAMNIALDNHLERNFKLTLSATEKIVQNGIEIKNTLDYLQLSQTYYADFHKNLYLSERHFSRQIQTMQSQSVRLKNLINKL